MCKHHLNEHTSDVQEKSKEQMSDGKAKSKNVSNVIWNWKEHTMPIPTEYYGNLTHSRTPVCIQNPIVYSQ